MSDALKQLASRQFMGFAGVVLDAIEKITEAHAYGSPEWRDAAQKCISRYAYRFACDIAGQVYEGDAAAMDCGMTTPQQVVSKMEDRTERNRPLHKYCPQCNVWRDADGEHCGKCGALLALRQLGQTGGVGDGDQFLLD